jgi:hypothetical protein
MRSDEERFRFLEEFKLSVTRNNDGVSIFWRGRDSPGQPGQYSSVASGRTLADTVDQAIARWEKKHGQPYRPGNGQ